MEGGIDPAVLQKEISKVEAEYKRQVEDMKARLSEKEKELAESKKAALAAKALSM